MTLEQFRAKWGLVFSSLLICELITRIDSNAQLAAIANELADDLRKLLAVEKEPASHGSADFPRRVVERLDNFSDKEGFPRRIMERPDSISGKEGER